MSGGSDETRIKLGEQAERIVALENFIMKTHNPVKHLLEAPEHKKDWSVYQGVLVYVPVSEVQEAFDLLGIAVERRVD